jgi:hypothetical protein
MRRLAALAVSAVALALPATSAASTTTQRIDFVGDVVLCTSGDDVQLEGTLLATTTVTTTPSGGMLAAMHFQPQGISGVDTTTGTTYRAVGLTRDVSVSSPPGGYTETFVNQFHIQATSGAESFLVSEIYHITIEPNGTVAVEFDKFSATC